MVVYDSKGTRRTLKNFNSKTGRKTYEDKEYVGPVIRRGMFSVPVDKVMSYGEWLEKKKKKK